MIAAQKDQNRTLLSVDCRNENERLDLPVCVSAAGKRNQVLDRANSGRWKLFRRAWTRLVCDLVDSRRRFLEVRGVTAVRTTNNKILAGWCSRHELVRFRATHRARR